MASVLSASASFLITKSNTAMSSSVVAHKSRLVFSQSCSVSCPSRSRLNISVIPASRFDRPLSGKFKGFHISKRPSILKSYFAEVIAHGSSNNTSVATTSSAIPSTEGNGEEEETRETSSASTSTLSDVSISAFMSEAMNYAKFHENGHILLQKLFSLVLDFGLCGKELQKEGEYVGTKLPLMGGHPCGEHPSRTLFVRNINSNVEEK